MLAIMVANLEGDFMITRSSSGKYFLALMSVLFILAASCKPDETDDDIPYIPFPDIVINLSLPEYAGLQSLGTYKSINGGVKGIIIYHNADGNFLAFERNCSYHPNDACSTVEVEITGLRMIDTCCGSIFNFEGNPIDGPAWRPLRQYYTERSASELTITDDVIN
jgi:hypothetical protein